ncbi:hypothetical protein P3S67_016212 [Capsicum chacoense]
MKNKIFLCFRPVDVAEDSVIRNHHSSVKRHHKEDSTLKTKRKRTRSSKDKSLTKASSSSSSELSYSTSSLSSTTSSLSSCSSTEDELSRSNSSTSSICHHQKEAKIGLEECDKVMDFSSRSCCVFLFIFILFVLIYIGKVYAIVITSLGVMIFTLVGRVNFSYN